MTSPLLTQGIPAFSTLSSSTIVELLVSSPAISLPAILKPLPDQNIVFHPTPAKKTSSVFLPLFSLSLTFLLSAQGILALLTLLSIAVIESSIPLAT